MSELRIPLNACPICGSIPRNVQLGLVDKQEEQGERLMRVVRAVATKATLFCTNFHFWTIDLEPGQEVSTA